ncbi:MAG: hypothetical protein ABIU54_10485 [Candidatus Eisenbacteria bacterium]
MSMPHRLIGCVLVLNLHCAVALPPARAATADEFPIPKSSRFT